MFIKGWLITSGLGMGHVPTSFSSRTSSGADMCRPWACSQSRWDLVCTSPVDLGGLFSWCRPSPLALTLFLPPLLQGSQSSEEEGFDSYIPFKAGYSKVSHSLHAVWLWGSVFVPICRRKPLWWGLICFLRGWSAHWISFMNAQGTKRGLIMN